MKELKKTEINIKTFICFFFNFFNSLVKFIPKYFMLIDHCYELDSFLISPLDSLLARM